MSSGNTGKNNRSKGSSENRSNGGTLARILEKIVGVIWQICVYIGRFIYFICRGIKKAALRLGRFYKEKTVPVLITALAVLIVVLVFTLIMGGGVSGETLTKQQVWMNQLKEKDIEQCQVESINTFFDKYYQALSVGDTTTLETMFDDSQKANITTELSSIVDRYEDLTVYVTPGINSGEVLAFVKNSIYFVNIDQATPSVDSFYIKMDGETDSIYILTDMYSDADINTFMYLATYREPIRSLLAQTEEELNTILENNSDLRNIYIIMSAMTDESAQDQDESESR